MLKREEILLPNSCLNKAVPDEPIFVLLGRDPAATTAIEAWIQERIKRGLNTADDTQIQQARRFTVKMAVYSYNRRFPKDR